MKCRTINLICCEAEKNYLICREAEKINNADIKAKLLPKINQLKAYSFETDVSMFGMTFIYKCNNLSL